MAGSSPHCPSYYAATCNDDRQYPRLEGSHKTDICVIGGGFTGVSTALSLAERGYSVCIVEQNCIAWGASGRNGGQLIGGLNGEARMLREWGGGSGGHDFCDGLSRP